MTVIKIDLSNDLFIVGIEVQQIIRKVIEVRPKQTHYSIFLKLTLCILLCLFCRHGPSIG